MKRIRMANMDLLMKKTFLLNTLGLYLSVFLDNLKYTVKILIILRKNCEFSRDKKHLIYFS